MKLTSLSISLETARKCLSISTHGKTESQKLKTGFKLLQKLYCAKTIDFGKATSDLFGWLFCFFGSRSTPN
jgi:hypothetical protein